MFIAQYKDGSSFSEKEGYWDNAPDNGITALHLTLPFAIKKIGTGEILNPSTVKISGYEAYYFANYATTIALLINPTTAVPQGQGQFEKQIMCGIDYTHDFVLWVEIDKRGNVTTKRFTAKKFMDEIKPHPEALRKGA